MLTLNAAIMYGTLSDIPFTHACTNSNNQLQSVDINLQASP
jgi:hypothetical protein